MFIHRIFTRIHKLKPNATYPNNSRPVNNNYIKQLSTRPMVPVVNIISTSSRRNISFQSLRKPNIEKLKLADKIPNNYELIYRCTMSSYLYAAQISATIGVIFVCVTAVINLNMDSNHFLISYDYIDLHNLHNSEMQFVAFSVGFILINIAVLTLVNKFPIRIYFNKDLKRYISIFYGKIPKTKNIIEYNIGDVRYTPTNSILPWGEFRYKLRSGKSIILLDHYFRKPDDMNIMLGHTKQ